MTHHISMMMKTLKVATAAGVVLVCSTFQYEIIAACDAASGTPQNPGCEDLPDALQEWAVVWASATDTSPMEVERLRLQHIETGAVIERVAPDWVRYELGDRLWALKAERE